MTAPRTTTMHRPANRPDVVTAVHGARWFTAAALAVGAVNYGYALLLTRLLDVGSYARFVAGQWLLLSAATVATVTVPWVLAQALARARSDAERGDAGRFAVITSIGGGLVMGGVVAAVATRFAGPATTLALALSTLLVYSTTVTAGWLQGGERMRALSLLHVVEVLTKMAVGVFLVVAFGLADTGALAAFGIGALPFLLWWPSLPRGSGRPWRSASANRDLWRRALGIARLQGLVALMAAVDVVLVTMLPTAPAQAASYQASVTLSRVPLFVAAAVSMAFFPALSRRRAGSRLSGSAVRMYVVVSLPLTATLATVPGPVLSTVFPAGYSMMSSLMAFTALTGFAIGAVNLAVTFSQAVDDYACARWQIAALAGYTLALLAGWHIDGVRGIAVGGALGAAGALALLLARLVHRQGTAFLRHTPLLEPLLLAALLVLLRPFPLVWLIAATAIGVRAVERFLRRPGAPDPAEDQTEITVGHAAVDPSAALPETPTDRPGGTMTHAKTDPANVEVLPAEERPGRLLVEAVWRGNARPAGDAALRHALRLARDNQVEGRLARAYPRQLADVLTEVGTANELFRENLVEVTGRLYAAGIPTVLIKADLAGDYVYGNFDLVVPDGRWEAACDALEGWYADRSTYWLERSTKVLLEPRSGPAAHLHTAVSWFGVPVLPTRRLFERAAPAGGAWLVPRPADELRIWLAHGLFQNLSLDLSELFAVRKLLAPDIVAEARREAVREGWAAGADRALAVAVGAMRGLDEGTPVRLPVPLPVGASLRVGAEHALHLLRNGRARAAAREAALRVPLVVAKRRRMLVS
ncbi:O-antigen/teichoic acid export membrane protein [Streptomyces luteogriseus]|uniref:lipopolysaccharide biosynthesis protein n=1 Tax=Streptomyces luteogriseus TaxID=68233 RepID=UPI00278100A4|nr:lipopolysaccharide biosynthesis protein [Streptomyces luteogriseus]MDQ0717736.1 O-antigen/teichoic acid export membrane protein [Streptomyces luteogriseus]